MADVQRICNICILDFSGQNFSSYVVFIAMKLRNNHENERINGPVNAHLISGPIILKHKAYKTRLKLALRTNLDLDLDYS